jgi:ubiquinone biosynthesis accessory factor UbiJ
MANPVTDWLLPAATERFILLANHVLASAPVACERLKAHAGRRLRVEVEGWRFPLPPPPALTLRVTPAGLFESADIGPEAALDAPPPELRLRVDASQPVDAARRLVSGELPAVQIEGDAAFATDVSWVIANVRWDIPADLERVFGTLAAGGLAQAGDKLLATAKSVAQGVASVLRRP